MENFDVLQMIAEAASRYPDRAALITQDRTVTYKELDRRSDSVASFVRSKVRKHEVVALRGNKEPEMLIGCIGIIKAGSPYMPIDTLIPEERAAFMLETSGATLTLAPADIASIGDTAPTPGSSRSSVQDGPLYIMFTSGSTGRPKGVVVTARNVEAFLSWFVPEQDFRYGQEIFLDQVPYSFDVSVMSMFPSLISGGTLFGVPKDDVANPARLHNRLANSGITTWVSTPSFARFCLAEETFDERAIPTLKRFIFCGETLSPGLVSELRKRFSRAEVWNTYGPTETTIAITSVKIDDDMIEKYGRVPLGYAHPQDAVRLVDNEIFISGSQVSPGYLGSADTDAFFETDHIRSYRTGDGGHVADEVLFFDGRLDSQIKLHGYRIELGDIEANLRMLPGVYDAVVVVHVEDGEPDSLLSFVVLSERLTDGAAKERELREALAARVPQYMLPRSIKFMSFLPLTPSGKVDRAKLAAMPV